jgi:hypothetical protein
MAQISLKILLIASISSFVFFFNSDNSKSCWYEYEEPINGLFNGYVIKEATLSPFFYVPTPNYFGHPPSDSSLISENDNLKEWGDYFQNNGNKNDVTYLIYKSSVQDIESIISAISNSQTTVNAKLLSNSIVKYLVKNKSVEGLNYLLFAKRCEPSAVGFRTNNWDELVRDTTEMKTLISDGLNEYTRCTDIFLKMRYAYQIIRLTHYLKHYDETVRLYDLLVTSLNSKSIIKYWALSHKAGALASLGEQAQSNYLFSKIFDECLSKRLLADLNFKVKEASQLTETLEYCQNNHEKNVVWFLYSYHSSDMGGLKRIYELEPSSPYLEVLLGRAIDQMEEGIFRYWQKMIEPNWTDDFTRLDNKQFYSFVKTVASNRNTKRPYFWEYCAGYLSLLSRDYISMKYHFQIAKTLLPIGEEEFLERMKMLEIYSKADEVKDVNLIFESKIVEELKWLLGLQKRHADEAFKWAILKLADKYLTQKDTAKYLICQGQKLSSASYSNTLTFVDYKSNPSAVPLNKLISYLQNCKYYESSEYYDLPEFDRFLINNFCYTQKDILEIQGTLYLSEYKFNKAISVLYDIRNELEYLPADPFTIDLKDCQSCDAKSLTKKLYTKFTFALKLKNLEEEIKTNKKNLDENYFLLANAYYNMSYFGNSWMSTDFYRSRFANYYSPNNLDWSKAEEYYLKAMTHSNDKEFIAKCAFMAAKCEQNRFYLDKGYLIDDNEYHGNCEQNPEIKKENYRTYFKVLKDKYSKTKFYQQALKECKYFNYFVTNKK